MGYESIRSGVSPDIAQTIVDVGRMCLTARMHAALALSFRRVGAETPVGP